MPEPVGKQPWLAAARVLLAESGCEIRRVTRQSGRAYTRSREWLIDVPPVADGARFGVFAHEVAHQLLHRHLRGDLRVGPRWREEIEAWVWALAQFDRFELPGFAQAERRATESLDYVLLKAVRPARDRAAMYERVAAEARAVGLVLDEDGYCLARARKLVEDQQAAPRARSWVLGFGDA